MTAKSEHLRFQSNEIVYRWLADLPRNGRVPYDRDSRRHHGYLDCEQGKLEQKEETR